jgi:hypothetical protein
MGAPITSMFEYFACKLRSSCRRHKLYILAKLQVVRDKATMAHHGGVGGVEVHLHSCLTSAINVGGWSTLRPGHFTNWGKQKPGTHLVRSSVGLRAGRDGFQRRSLAPSAIRIPDEPRRTKSLYRLIYPGSSLHNSTPSFNTSHLFSLQLPTTYLDLENRYRGHEQWNQKRFTITIMKIILLYSAQSTKISET